MTSVCIICKTQEERKKFKYLSTDFFECTGCGLIRTLPLPSEEQISEHYKKKFEQGNYHTLLSNMRAYVHIYKNYIELLKNKIGFLKGKRILDVGCFTGDFLDLAAEEGAETFGIELQKEAFMIASKKHPGRISNCSFNNAVFNKKFDVITMFGVIEHLDHPEILMTKVLGWLSSDGLIVIQTPNTGSIFAKLMNKFWPPYAPIEHIHYFSKNNIKIFLQNYHFANIEIMPHFKKLSIEYVINMLRNFGPEFYSFFSPIIKFLPNNFKSRKLIFYIGEMIVLARVNGRGNGIDI